MLTKDNHIDDNDTNIIEAALDRGARILWIFTWLSPLETHTILISPRSPKQLEATLGMPNFSDKLPPSTSGHNGDAWITSSNMYAYAHISWQIVQTARKSHFSHSHLKNCLLTFNSKSSAFEWPTDNYSR